MRAARQVSAGVYETAGLRGEDHMEDRHVIVEALGDDAATSLLAVFDGHRGPETAEFAVRKANYVFPFVQLVRITDD